MSKRHFSHHHLLLPLHLDEGEEINCSACERLITEPFHGCIACKQYLHDQCMNTPRYVQHPSHPSHPLTLLPSPTYFHGSYSCDACKSQGNSFSLSCAECEFDLHIHCASLPSKILLDAHRHELQLTFDFPYSENTIFVCDVCGGKVAHSSWVYNCADCDFGVHLDCKMSNQMTRAPKVDGVSAIRQAANEMLETQVEMMRLQNKINLNQTLANIIARRF